MSSPAQDTTESQRNDQTFAPGLMVKVRDELWLITNVTQSVDGYLLKVRGLSDYVRDTTASFYTALDDVEVFDPAKVEVVADQQLSRVVAGLADHGIDAVQTKNAELASHEQVSVMTMHGAKGMEFTHVILMGVGKDIMPVRYRLKHLSEADARAALQRERSLLYVAASRARDELVITTVGDRSELLPAG